MNLLLDDEQPPRALDRTANGFRIEGANPAKVDYLRLDTFCSQKNGGLKCTIEHQERTHDREVGPATDHARSSDLGDLADTHSALPPEESFVFMDQNWVRVPDGRLQ